MEIESVTLGGGARHWCLTHGVEEDDLRAARAQSRSERLGLEFVTVSGELSDGRRVQMKCPREEPSHVESFRVVH